MRRSKEELEKIVAIPVLEKLAQEHITKTVKSLGYKTEDSIAKYLVTGNHYYDECKALSIWIGDVWKTTYDIINEIKYANRSIPKDFVALLPAYK